MGKCALCDDDSKPPPEWGAFVPDDRQQWIERVHSRRISDGSDMTSPRPVSDRHGDRRGPLVGGMRKPTPCPLHWSLGAVLVPRGIRHEGSGSRTPARSNRGTRTGSRNRHRPALRSPSSRAGGSTASSTSSPPRPARPLTTSTRHRSPNGVASTARSATSVARQLTMWSSSTRS